MTIALGQVKNERTERDIECSEALHCIQHNADALMRTAIYQMKLFKQH